MAEDAPRSFDDLEALAARLVPVQEWRSAIARGVHAVTGRPAVVHTSMAGNMLDITFDGSPDEITPVAARLVSDYVPRVGLEGGRRRQVELSDPVFALEAGSDGLMATNDAVANILVPNGYQGLVTALMFVTPGAGPVGGVSIYCREHPRADYQTFGQRMGKLARVMGEHIGAVVEMARAFGVSAPQVDVQRLSARELQITLLVAEGFSNAQVAEKVGIAESTVAVHLRGIFKKLQVHSRTELTNVVLKSR